MSIEQELEVLEQARMESIVEEREQHILLYGKDLKFALIQRRQEELDKAQQEWEENGGNGKKPSILSTLQCAIILQEYIECCLFDERENTRLAIYLPKEGIYTQNRAIMQRLIGWLEPTHNERKAEDVIYHLRKDAKIRHKTSSRFLIPVNNGVFNLKTKRLEPYAPNYVFTSKIATSYVENPSLPKINDWDIETWFNDISCGDVEIVQLLWEVINDAMNSNFTRRKSIWLVGDGSNGKGTFQQLLFQLIGDKNIAPLKIDQFKERFQLATLIGKVCVIGDDVQANIYVDNSSHFNSVVSGDPILVEKKHQGGEMMVFYLTVIQSTNGMPKVKNKTDGTYRRLVIVPFNASFEGIGDNWKIKDEYIKRKDVLQYVLHKAIHMDFEKFSMPNVSKQLLEEYKQENDPLVDFKVAIFDQLGLNKIPFYIVYSMYKSFCKENNFSPLSRIRFSKEFSKVLGTNWENKIVKYKTGDLGKLDLMNYDSFVEYPKDGKAYQCFIRNDLKLIS